MRRFIACRESCEVALTASSVHEVIARLLEADPDDPIAWIREAGTARVVWQRPKPGSYRTWSPYRGRYDDARLT